MDQKTPLTKIQKSVSLYAREEKSSYMDHIGYALYAFGGLGIELLLILLETKIYAIPSESWNTGQNILHWVITCSLWGGIGYLLAQKLPPHPKKAFICPRNFLAFVFCFYFCRYHYGYVGRL